MKLFLKRTSKSIVGAYNERIFRDFLNRFLKTKKYFEQARFEKQIIDFYSQFIKEGDLCFDVGANFGNRTQAFLSLKARVVAIEPQESCSRYLKKKFGERIILINKALGPDEQSRSMYLSTNSAISSLAADWINLVKQNRFKEHSWTKTKKVNVTTLDSLILMYGNPDFIKIDVEGYEYEVIKGLTKSCNMISFEYTVPEQLDKVHACIDYLEKINNNVICNYSRCEELKLILETWLKPREMKTYLHTDAFLSSSVGDIYIKRI